MATQKKSPARKNRGGTLLGVFIGLVLGVVLSAAVMWYINGSSLPLQVRPSAPPPAAPPAEPAALPGKPGDKAPEKRFDFYDLLPGDARTPGDTPSGGAETPVSPPPADTPATRPDDKASATLLLQAGAFSSEDDADNLRARLALIGIESRVQKSDVPGKGMMYRIRLGPFANVEDMQRVRAELAQNGIDASIVR
ncbi:SPOR domain-containing protein [Methyloversatilis thermotolerans]|uniref:SPOR domain-containing protein n=1 Tax=Methyloversatilis thermotolerans TaxID=1346290 RepID=UPI00036C6DED|nr:SPOR domain-containing protein [Methyloversatilis thermotolerans]